MFQARYYKATLRTPHLSLRTYLAKNLSGHDGWSLWFVLIICKCLQNFAPGAGLEKVSTPQTDFQRFLHYTQQKARIISSEC